MLQTLSRVNELSHLLPSFARDFQQDRTTREIVFTKLALYFLNVQGAFKIIVILIICFISTIMFHYSRIIIKNIALRWAKCGNKAMFGENRLSFTSLFRSG